MSKLYYWRWGNVGHTSLELSDGTYISHWPEGAIQKTETLNNFSAMQMPSLDGDVYCQGCEPHHTLSISKDLLDTAKIKKWWSKYCRNANYNMVFENCTHTVSQAIQQGLETILVAGFKHNFNWTLAETPQKVYETLKWVMAQKTSWDNTRAGQVWKARNIQPFYNGFVFPDEDGCLLQAGRK